MEKMVQLFEIHYSINGTKQWAMYSGKSEKEAVMKLEKDLETRMIDILAVIKLSE